MQVVNDNNNDYDLKMDEKNEIAQLTDERKGMLFQ